jgi:rare lipoprotein A
MSDIYKNILLIILLVLALTDVRVNQQGNGGPKNTKEEVGVASWYSVKSSSNITASGERFLESGYTCAKWGVPFGTVLKVTNIANGKFVLVKCNDRGPNKRLNRVIDLSPKAFSTIADLKDGLINVKVEVIK